jgi:hypothetical protein
MEINSRQEKSVIATKVTGCHANSLVAMQSQRSQWRGYGCCGKFLVSMNSHWVLWKSLVTRKSRCCYGSHWLLYKFTGCYAKPEVALERLRLLWKVQGRYEESVVAIEVIGLQEKSMVATEVTVYYANSLVAMQSQQSLLTGYGCCEKSVVDMKSKRVLCKSLDARKSQ